MPPVDHIRYDLLAQEALRGVVRRVLMDVARDGLPGDHHFYLSFDTRAPGVRLSQRMREQYPEDMTIVLQHQFWDMTVTEHALEVGLSFGGVPEKLLIPFSAMKGFFDPSVKFGLQFDLGTPEDEPELDGEQDDAVATLAPVASLPTAARPPRGAGSEPSVATTETAETPADGDKEGTGETPPAGGAEVVRLDVFRKK
ncbi:hypothetical protein GCM10007301_39330 [Azorhizobium oxalatiphilum]|uniref:Stringent starvation protein B n=1 Tax=Azorhizobium oxalatiphilum TaxID=980631 RepID=A0A917FFZ1_9HYPH|nr:ClpXP protease specificity-enhancing factor SspB [Azorhizobium oxalatiphilum]GGF75536.1 hypothetical protein GCM10007301_39330 [Azorhizobium oxalatiphilum]